MPGTAPFSEININGFRQTPAVLDDFLKWPAKIDKFSFRFSYDGPYWAGGLYNSWALSTLHPMLSRHKQTLRHLRVGDLNCKGLAGFDLSTFTSLETLSLSYGSTGTDITTIANLMAPRLEVFRWDLDQEENPGGDYLDSFAQPEDQWLRALVDAFIARKVPLREIKIHFDPSLQVLGDGDVKYPWDYMDAIGRDLGPKGIALSYDTPNISRDEFYEEYGNTGTGLE